MERFVEKLGPLNFMLVYGILYMISMSILTLGIVTSIFGKKIPLILFGFLGLGYFVIGLVLGRKQVLDVKE